MVKFEQLISHRFRGFSKHENTIEGLRNALDFGVQIIEFDIRVTACETPIIYHDEYARDKHNKKRFISKSFTQELNDLGGVFPHMPTADALFEAAASHENKTCKLLVDIKDAGFEVEIDALIRTHGLADRTVYVSWIPNVLYRMAEIAPDIPLCLSHWPSEPGKAIRDKHIVHTARVGQIERLKTPYIHGERSGWYIRNGLRGDLRMKIRQSGGSVCVPVDMLDHKLVKDYQAEGIQVSAFSFTDLDTINQFDKSYSLDLYFVDSKQVFIEAKRNLAFI